MPHVPGPSQPHRGGMLWLPRPISAGAGPGRPSRCLQQALHTLYTVCISCRRHVYLHGAAVQPPSALPKLFLFVFVERRHTAQFQSVPPSLPETARSCAEALPLPRQQAADSAWAMAMLKAARYCRYHLGAACCCTADDIALTRAGLAAGAAAFPLANSRDADDTRLYARRRGRSRCGKGWGRSFHAGSILTIEASASPTPNRLTAPAAMCEHVKPRPPSSNGAQRVRVRGLGSACGGLSGPWVLVADALTRGAGGPLRDCPPAGISIQPICSPGARSDASRDTREGEQSPCPSDMRHLVLQSSAWVVL